MTTDEKHFFDDFCRHKNNYVSNYITQQHWHDIAKMQSNKFLKNMQQTAILIKIISTQ